jgi:hypothetical protein
VVGVIPSIQRIRVGAERAGQLAHVWVDERSVHISIGGDLVVDGRLIPHPASVVPADSRTVAVAIPGLGMTDGN